MDLGFTFEGDAKMHGLWEKTGDDIVVRLDKNGFVTSATANFIDLGYDLDGLLLKPHLTDFSDGDFSRDLGAHFQDILTGGNGEEWIEFPLRKSALCQSGADAALKCWYAISLVRVEEDNGEVSGALGIVRSVERLHALEGELYSRALVDPLTGLANRHAFCANLRRQLASGTPGFMALFEVDRLRAVFMQYGQRTNDEIIWGFARFLEAMALPGCEVAQFDGERFGVIVPEASRKEARLWSRDVVETFSTLTLTTSRRVPKLTASAGLAVIECTVDWTLRQAELGLVMARARGGQQVAQAAKLQGQEAAIAPAQRAARGIEG